MNKKNDRDLYLKLDQLDVNQANLLMSQIEVTDEEPIAAEIIARIKADTFTKLGLTQTMGITTPFIQNSKSRSRTRGKRKRNLAIGIASIVFVAYVAISSPEVRAQIHRAFQFIPGFATVQDTEKELVQYVLPNPVEVPTNAGYIQIRGLSIGAERSFISIVSSGTSTIRSFILNNGEGKSYPIKYGSISSAGTQWIGSYYYEGQIEVTDKMSISFDEQSSIIPLHLTRVQQAEQINDFGTTDTHHGVSLTALSSSDDNRKTKVTLLPQVTTGMRIDAYGFAQYDYVGKPELTNNKGELIALQRDPDFPNPNEFSFERGAEASASYKLIIPAVSAVKKAEKQESFTVPIPKQSEIVLNKLITANGYPIEITKVERLPRASSAIQKDELKIYFDVHYDENAAESLLYITPDFTKHEVASGAQWQVNEQSRALEYMIVEVPSTDKEYTLYIAEAHIIIRGPWEFHIQ